MNAKPVITVDNLLFCPCFQTLDKNGTESA